MPPVALGALEARLPRTPLTRFAPSPTGYLHLGHVVNAIWVWGLARALEGRVLLRIEDHDRGRCRPDYEAALLEDLAWLGLTPDLGPTRQRDATSMYLDTLAALEQRGLVYACDCSRRDISREAGDVPHLETRYPGRCRDRGLPSGWRALPQPTRRSTRPIGPRRSARSSTPGSPRSVRRSARRWRSCSTGGAG